jgi:hypothetical protein
MERVRNSLGDNGFKAAGELGTAMTLREATDYALMQVRHASDALEPAR